MCGWVAPYKTTVPMRGVFGFQADDVFAVGGNESSGGLLVHFNGERWREIVPPETLIDLPISANDIWGFKRGDVRELFIAHDYGVLKASIEKEEFDWKVELDTSEQLPMPLESLFDAAWRGVFGNSDSEIYAVGGTINVPLAGGTIAYYSGDKWTDMVGGEKVDLGINSIQDIHGFGSGAPLFAVTATPMNFGQVLKFTGEGWVVDHNVIPNVFLGEWTGLYGVWGRGPNDLYAVGSRSSLSFGGIVMHGVIYRYTDDDDWSRLTVDQIPEHTEFRGVWGRSTGPTVITVGKKKSDGIAMIYDGDTWSEMYFGWQEEEPFAFPLNRIWGDEQGNLFIVGDEGIYYCLMGVAGKGLSGQDVSFGR